MNEGLYDNIDEAHDKIRDDLIYASYLEAKQKDEQNE